MKFDRLVQNDMPTAEMVEIEIGNRIPIWRTLVFRNRKQLYLSCGLSYNYEIRLADRYVYLVLHSFAVQLIGSCDTVLVVLESMLATSISPTSTMLMTQSFLLMIQRNGTMFFEILRHQQALWVSTQTGIKRRSKILELELLQEQSILTIKQ